MNKVFLNIFSVWCMLNIQTPLVAQESIFTGLQSDLKKADEFYQNQAYPDAIKLYKRLFDKNKREISLLLKIADSYYFSNEMDMAVQWYERYIVDGSELKNTEILRYAGSLQTIGHYENAISWLQKYSFQFPDDFEISKRIWQLQNVKFLYEDSMYYNLKLFPLNTLNDEFAPTIYGNSIIFASNKDQVTTIKRNDATTDKSFYNWYISNTTKDSTDVEMLIEYTDSEIFANEINAKYHKGPLSFYPGGDTMVFSRTSYRHNNSNVFTTKIFFAKKEDKHWKEFAAFPHNSLDYSINHPALSADGKTMYFSSDMPGGSGGTDLYSSNFIQGKWTLPKNLGQEINTSKNENYPFIQNDNLYFSSNGHPGLGGMDIFSVNLSDRPIKIRNIGYPINTQYDDFNLVLDNNGTFGYLVSNRNKGVKTNDDIFEVYINKPSFPLIVKGEIKYKNRDLIDSTSEMILLSNAKLELIDKSQKDVVYVTNTDANAKFTLEIPYDSQFLLRVIHENFGTAIVSMEMPRNHLDNSNHDIVIVKDLFKSSLD